MIAKIWILQWIMIHCNMMSVTRKLTCSRFKKWQNFGIQNCVKFVLFKVLQYVWYQNNRKFDHLS